MSQGFRPTRLFSLLSRVLLACTVATGFVGAPFAQTPAPPVPPGPASTPAGGSATTPAKPSTDAKFATPEYVIGADDVLNVRVWEEDRIAGDVRVRQDGKITLPLIGELVAAGLTPTQFREALTAAARKYVQSPTVDVIVKETMSKRVFIQGEVRRPDTYPLSGRMTITQLIARAGGFSEYADKGKITILRIDKDGNTTLLRVNYNELNDGKNMQKNNVELQNGDVVNVPD